MSLKRHHLPRPPGSNAQAIVAWSRAAGSTLTRYRGVHYAWVLALVLVFNSCASGRAPAGATSPATGRAATSPAAGRAVTSPAAGPGVTSTPRHASPTTAAAAAPAATVANVHPDWIIQAQALRSLLSLDTTGVVPAEMNGSNNYVIGRTSRDVPSGWSDRLAQSFTSLTGISGALATGLDPAVQAVLYDLEAWTLSPLTEQRDPGGSYTQAAALAHARGLPLIATPGLDLMGVLQPGGGPYDVSSIAYGLAGLVAKPSDVYEIQAQSFETDTARFTNFVEKAAAQARAAHAGISVFAGLSTNPGGVPVSAATLAADVQATKGLVDGYWLNIPGAGVQCPTCGVPQTKIGLDLLTMLATG